MIDRYKRNLLKLGGLFTAGALLPASVTAKAFASRLKPSSFTVQGGLLRDGNLSIELIAGDQPSMRITNSGSELTIVRQLSPGVVRVNGNAYDLNSSFSGSAYAVGAGRTRHVPVTQLNKRSIADASEMGTKPFKVVAVTANKSKDRLVHADVAFA